MGRIFERRSFTSDVEVRETPTTISIRGYAAIFDSPSHGEVVRRGAFDATLAKRDDVRMLFNHDPNLVLARTKSGTLDLGVDETGLWYDAPSLDRDNPDVQRLASQMRRKDVDQSSFAFVDRTPQEQRYDENNERNICTVDLFDVSPVTFPWYEDTTSEFNALDEAFACIRNGAALSREQRDLFVKLVIFDDDDDDMTEDLTDVGESEPLPADADPMMMASAKRLEAAKALLHRVA